MGIISFLRGVAASIICVLALICSIYFGFSELRYSYEGNIAQAVVTERDHARDSRGRDVYTIYYTYTTRYGENYNRHEVTDDDTYYILKEGHKFQVDYLSSEPSINERVGSYRNLRIAGIALALSFLCFVFAIWHFFGRSSWF